MPQQAIPCLFMRGGTSRGPYFRTADLPADPKERDRVLLAALGSPDPRQIDGLGGATTLTSKVAMIAPSTREGVDVDYLFAQVSVDDATVDTQPSCGNMLSGVGPAAIELGLIPAKDGETKLVVYNENTRSRIEVVVRTPNGKVDYDGDIHIDGVPGTSAPILMNFMDVVGSKTGALLPTGRPMDTFQGLDVSCVDAAMPMILLRASDFGISLEPGANQFVGASELFDRIEAIRLEAGQRMGLGDVSNMVIPKVGLLAEPTEGGDIRSWYLTPHSLHAAHAVTGAVCVSSAAIIEGTVAHALARRSDANPRDFVIEHPSGRISIHLEAHGDGEKFDVVAGTVRTARLIMRGEVMVPSEPPYSAAVAVGD